VSEAAPISPELAALFAARALGEPLQTLALKGTVELPGGAARPWLVLTGGGLWLAAAGADGQGLAEPALEARPLRYRPGALGDRLLLGGRTLAIPAGRGEKALALLARARLRPPQVSAGRVPKAGRFLEAQTAAERMWLEAALGPGEVALAWLHTATGAPLEDPVLEGAAPEWRLLVTDRRAALVAVSDAGDAAARWLTHPLTVEARAGRDRVRAGDERWSTTLLNQDLYASLAPATAAEGEDRVRAVARLNLASRAAAHKIEGEALLAALEDPLSQLAGWIRSHEPAPPEALVEALVALGARRPEEELAALWARWGADRARGYALVDALRSAGEGRWSLALHAAVHAAGAGEKDPFARALEDIRYAEHLLDAGRGAQAAALLEARLATLPEEDLADLLPPEGADLTAGAGGQIFRVRIYELLLHARGEPDRDDTAAAASLARLQPLVPARLQLLAALIDDPRPALAAAALAPGGLRPGDEAPGDGPIHPLPAALIEQRLQHPVARPRGALGRLQAMLASAEVPESASLKAWCERLTPRQSEAARDALADAALALGVAGLDAFISRGEKSVGLRAYEGSPTFLLIGGEHLDPDSPFFMRPCELRFAIGAEVAHLRFKHARVTASEVWSGAWEKGMVGLDVMLTVLPAVKGWSLAEKLAGFASERARAAASLVLEKSGVGRDALSKAGQAVEQGPGMAGQAAISSSNEQLVAAHRVMQLTSDRAGLVLCGQIQAALRGMFLTYPSYQAELALIERHGLPTALGRRDEAGALRYQDLSIRAAALLSFYLSEDYAVLREALTRG
jgi:hypothetical protein